MVQVGIIFKRNQRTAEMTAYATVHREKNGNYTAFDKDDSVLAVERNLENLLMWAINQRVDRFDESIYFFPYGSIGKEVPW